MSSRTSPHNNISPVDTPPRPSRASPAPPIDLGARGIAEMALPPTLHQEKNNPFPIDAARCEDYPQDPTSPQDNISPGDSPPRPSRVSHAPPSIWERGACWLSLPPTTTKKNLFLLTLRVVMEKKNALKMPPSPATMAALGTLHPAPQEPRPCQQGDVEVLLTVGVYTVMVC